MFKLSMDTSSMDKQLKKLMSDSPVAFRKAMEIGGLQFLTWVVNGSSKESRKPPIAKGFLRGSGSVFVGSKLVGVAPGNNKEANKSHTEKDFTITWGFNAAYATKMHETEYNLGPVSTQDGDSGNKYLERHLVADRENLMALIAKEVKKELGT